MKNDLRIVCAAFLLLVCLAVSVLSIMSIIIELALYMFGCPYNQSLLMTSLWALPLIVYFLITSDIVSTMTKLKEK
jgi:hypothetical protein